MKKTSPYIHINRQKASIGMLSLILLLIGCDRNSVDNVVFGLRLQNDINTIYTDEFVTFEFEGNPDYLSFFSGEYGSKYANSNRTKLELDSLGVSYTARQNYSDPADYSNKAILHVLISEDFDGNYTPDGISAANWTELSGTEPGQLQVPIPKTNSTLSNIDYTAADLTPYKDKRIFFALRYAAAAHTGTRYAGQPRIDITNLRMDKREPDKNIQSITDLVSEWGFKPVFVKSTSQQKYNVAKASLLFQPTSDHQKDSIDIWMVSQKLDFTSVQPDRGIAIKSINARLANYQFMYSKPGTYTASFVATNSNKWNSTHVVREITFTVKERPTKQ